MSGWQQKPIPPDPWRCHHLDLLIATFTLHEHSEGHEWVCSCGQTFVVVSNGGRDKKFEKKEKATTSKPHTSDEELLLVCDSTLSLIFYRESNGLSEQTKEDLKQFLPKLRRRTDEIIQERRNS